MMYYFCVQALIPRTDCPSAIASARKHLPSSTATSAMVLGIRWLINAFKGGGTNTDRPLLLFGGSLSGSLCYFKSMSYYNPPRSRNLFDPKSKEPFVLSRSKIDSFIKCPRCFYLDRRLGLGEPPMPSFTLNDAVDTLMKKEFDILRAKSARHALMEKYNINAVPLVHPELADWRDDSRKYLGATTLHKKTNFIISGIVDDVWVAPDETLFMVDYKSTSTTREISLDDEYKQGYKRQVEIYQWIFRQKGFKVSDTAYFVFANAQKSNEKFDGKLEFIVNIIAYDGKDSWVEPTIEKIRRCLDSDVIPDYSKDCDLCKYRLVGQKLESTTMSKISPTTVIQQVAEPDKTKIEQKEEKLTKQSLF